MLWLCGDCRAARQTSFLQQDVWPSSITITIIGPNCTRALLWSITVRWFVLSGTLWNFLGYFAPRGWETGPAKDNRDVHPRNYEFLPPVRDRIERFVAYFKHWSLHFGFIHFLNFPTGWFGIIFPQKPTYPRRKPAKTLTSPRIPPTRE